MSLEMNSQTYLTLAFERLTGFEPDWEDQEVWIRETHPSRAPDVESWEAIWDRLSKAPTRLMLPRPPERLDVEELLLPYDPS